MGSKTQKKIAAEGQVKSYTRNEKGVKPTFKDLLYGQGQVPLLDQWMDEHRKVRVTIEATEVLLTDGLDD